MATRTAFPRRADRGFSFIELLAYMAIAALLILAAVPQFSNYRDRAVASTARSDLHNASSAMEAGYDSVTGYPAALPASFKTSRGVTLTVGAVSDDAYCISATTDRGGLWKFESRNGGSITVGRCVSGGAITWVGDGWSPDTSMGINPTRWAGEEAYSLITLTDGPEGIQRAARATWKSSTPTGRGFSLVSNTEIANLSAGAAPVTPGRPTTLSLYVRSSTDTMNGSIRVRFADSSGTFIGSEVASPGIKLKAGQWTLATLTMTPPANAASLAAIYRLDSSSIVAPGDSLDATGVVYDYR